MSSRLERANWIRTTRASLLRSLGRHASSGAAARRMCAAHIDSPHEALQTIAVRDLLMACRSVGEWHTRMLLHKARIDADRKVGRLTDRERTALVNSLLQPWPYEAKPEELIAA